MNKAIACTGISLIFAGNCMAAGLVVEQFNYPTGNLVGQTNTYTGTAWSATGADALNPVQLAGGSLSVPGLTNTAGNKVSPLTMSSGNQDAGLDLAVPMALPDATLTKRIFYSMIVNVTANFAASPNGEFFSHISDAGTGAGSFYARLYARRGSLAGNTYFGISHSSNVPNTAVSYSTVDRPNGTPVFLVACYNSEPGLANDTVQLWINPALGSPEPAATVSSTIRSTVDCTQFGRINLRQSANAGAVEVDELRVGTSWSDVTGTNATLVPVELSGFGVE